MKPSRRYRVSEVRRLAQRRTSSLYDTWFTRNVSVWITAGLAPFGVSPNTVSLVNFMVGVGACVLIAFGNSAFAVLTGVSLVHFYAVLDSVDGELARLLDRRSLRGMFLEDWSAYGMIAGFPVAVALYLQGAGASPVAVGVAVVYAVTGRNVMPAVRRAIAQSSEAQPQRTTVAASGGRPVRVGGWLGSVERRLLDHTNIRLVLTVLILVHLGAPDLRAPLEFAFYGYMTALFLREAGICYLALRGQVIEDELQRLRGHGDQGGGLSGQDGPATPL